MRTMVPSKAPMRLVKTWRRSMPAGLLALAGLFALGARPACAQGTPAPRAGNPHGDMSLDCRLCHAEQDWSVDDKATAFDHGTTGFALEGRHALVACKDCHKQPQFAHIGTQCADCHLDAHKSQLGPACDQCHTPEGWVARTAQQREHDTTRLPLVGAHARVDCDACHTGPVSGEYVGTPYDCYACHQAEYDATSDPDHRLAGFTTDCERCHGVFSATWGSGDFIHAPNFPLTGAHATTACASCHAGQFAGTPTDCYACHQPDYDATVDPPHATANLGTACATCHGTSAWSPSTYDHSTPNDFRLEGGHRGVDCVACHETGYVGTPTDCYACHQADYAATIDPNHAASNIPTTCVVCHTTTAWTPAQFDHNTTAFPLTGAHRNTACAACHAAGYSGTPTDCYACHQADYAQTNNPSHVAAAFPTTCATCHTTTAWSPSSWDHEALFPIETGKHTNVSCVECHVTPGNYATFECILCHEHNQADMADRHSGRPDYQWNSLACLGCHPRGD